KKLWASTAHAFGYLPPAPPGSGPVPVVHAGDVRPDPSLKGARVRVTLDRLRVAQYPGGGTHRVLFDFYARNQADAGAEDLHFNLGLDFGSNPMGVRLAEGNYLAAQVPEDEARGWDWGKWAYDPRAGQVVGAGPQKEPLPFNYVVFGVSRYDGP